MKEEGNGQLCTHPAKSHVTDPETRPRQRPDPLTLTPNEVMPPQELCKHPRGRRYRDPDAQETICEECAEVLPDERPRGIPGAEKFGRAPENFAVFRHNAGSTSKRNGSLNGNLSHTIYTLSQVSTARETAQRFKPHF